MFLFLFFLFFIIWFFLFCILFLPIMNCGKFLWIWTQSNRLNYKLRRKIAETNVIWANKSTAIDSEKEIYFGGMHIFTRAHKHLFSAFVSKLFCWTTRLNNVYVVCNFGWVHFARQSITFERKIAFCTDYIMKVNSLCEFRCNRHDYQF